jgi:pimeloyl-ACP methyl ester carboxylesterase
VTERGPVPTSDVLAAMLVEELAEGPVVLVGHSQGCQIAAVAAADPRVAALVLLGPTTEPGLRRTAVLAGRWPATALAEPWWQLPLVPAQWSRTGPRGRLCRRPWAARLAAAAPRSRVVELPGAAHMTVQTHPRPLARLVRAEADRAGRDRAGAPPVLDREHRPAYFVDPTD